VYIVEPLILQPPTPFPLSRRVQCSPQHPVRGQRQQTFHLHNYCSNKMHYFLKAQYITICTFCLYILSPYMFRPTWAIFRGRNASA
jgi:hypothetical protein